MKTLVTASGFSRRTQPTFSLRAVEFPDFHLQGIRIDRLFIVAENSVTSVKKFARSFMQDAIAYKSVDNKVKRVAGSRTSI